MTRTADPTEIRLPVPRGELPAFTPVPRRSARHDGWTADRQRRFVEALADTGSVGAACRAVNMSTVGAYQLRRQAGAESFRAAWEAALDLGVQRIEDTAMDRALNGVEVPVYSYGELLGHRTVYNDRLLMFMLRNRSPDRFADGRTRRPDAIAKMELDRLKKEWRAEWEAEQAAKAAAADTRTPDEREDDMIAGINAKLEAMRNRWLNSMSPRTYAAHREYERLRQEDEDSGYSCFDDPEHPKYIDRASRRGAADEASLALPPPGWGEEEEDEDEPEENPKWRTLKDEGWD